MGGVVQAGGMPVVTLKAGTIHYEVSGPEEGRPVVFVHGYMMGSSLWRPLAARLVARNLRCIAPTWPLGAHTEAMHEGADLTMEGLATIVGDLLDALELQDVVLVGNDTGGAIAQIVATTNPSRLGALVLTSSDAFEHFPPPVLKPFIVASKVPPAFYTVVQPVRTRFGRKRAYGGLAHTDVESLAAEWVRPVLTDRRIRKDLRRFTGSMTRQTMTEAGERLPEFTKPALVAWSADDDFFPVDDGRRLAAALPSSRLEVVEGAKTFSMIDQPDVLAGLIGELAGAAAAV
jgi:pimeloyl-ACP methyl ester carboxylesterase